MYMNDKNNAMSDKKKVVSLVEKCVFGFIVIDKFTFDTVMHMY